MRLTEHARAVEKAKTRAQALDAALREAQQAGLVKFFNTQYRERRLEAFRHGTNFVPYPVAKARLMQAMASAAAQGGTVTSSVVDEVLG